MKEFVENSTNLKITNISKASLISHTSPIAKIEKIIEQHIQIGNECETVRNALDGYMNDMITTINTIFDGIEAKIEYMESYCDAITTNAKQIPSGSSGYIYTYNNNNIALYDMSHIKGLGYILEIK